MNRDALAKYEVRARTLKALAHPTRLLIVDELFKRERCVCEMAEMVGVDVSTISKHLSLLKTAGIIADEKRGSQVFYRLRTPCVLQVFDCVAAVMRFGSEQGQVNSQENAQTIAEDVHGLES